MTLRPKGNTAFGSEEGLNAFNKAMEDLHYKLDGHLRQAKEVLGDASLFIASADRTLSNRRNELNTARAFENQLVNGDNHGDDPLSVFAQDVSDAGDSLEISQMGVREVEFKMIAAEQMVFAINRDISQVVRLASEPGHSLAFLEQEATRAEEVSFVHR